MLKSILRKKLYPVADFMSMYAKNHHNIVK